MAEIVKCSLQNLQQQQLSNSQSKPHISIGTGYLISAGKVFGGGLVFVRSHLLCLQLDGCHLQHSLCQNFNFDMSRIKSGFRRHHSRAHTSYILSARRRRIAARIGRTRPLSANWWWCWTGRLETGSERCLDDARTWTANRCRLLVNMIAAR